MARRTLSLGLLSQAVYPTWARCRRAYISCQRLSCMSRILNRPIPAHSRLHFPSYGSNTPIVHNRNMDILVHRLITDTALYSCYRSKHSNQHVTQNGILCGRTHPWLLLEWPQIFYMGWTGKTRVPTL
ncbi:hypothetical protein BD769DRAFT_1478559 [Suillus cothurnatus]|nr:hypothetical protein BD769DRAFT_1478559 [Suillus cothurnatus]